MFQISSTYTGTLIPELEYSYEEEFPLILQRVSDHDPDYTTVNFPNDPSADNDAAAASLGDALMGSNTRANTARDYVDATGSNGDANDDSNSKVEAGAATATDRSTSEAAGNIINAFGAINGNTDAPYDTTRRKNSSNGYVKVLDITIHQLTMDGNYGSLLEWIQKSPSLETIRLDGHGDHTSPVAHPEVIVRFLQAITSSRHIRNLSLWGCFMIPVPTIVHLLSHNQSIVDLEIDCLTEPYIFVPSNRMEVDELNRIAMAFRNNTTLQRLSFDMSDRTMPFVAPIVRALDTNSTLLHLALEYYCDDDYDEVPVTFEWIQHLLTHNCTLRHLELRDFSFNNEAGMPIIQGIEVNRSLEKLSLHGPWLYPEIITRLQQAVVESTIQELCLEQAHLGDHGLDLEEEYQQDNIKMLESSPSIT